MQFVLEDANKAKRIADRLFSETVNSGLVNWEKFGSAIAKILEEEKPSAGTIAAATWRVAEFYADSEWSIRTREALDRALQVALVNGQIESQNRLAEASERLTKRTLWVSVIGVIMALFGVIIAAIH